VYETKSLSLPKKWCRLLIVEYTSPWLTHFVGQRLNDDARCDLLARILRGRTLGQWAHDGIVVSDPGTMLISGSGSLCRNEYISFRPVCFCDIPEESLQRHTNIYGRFGLAFKKEFLAAQGANPVFYVAKGSLAGSERRSVEPPTLEDLKTDRQAALDKWFASLNEEPSTVRRCEFFDRLVADLVNVLPPSWPPGTPSEAHDPTREVQRRVLSDLHRHIFAFMKFFDESLPEDHRDNFYMEREWRVAG
jgi:hypothetical protein